MFEEGATLTARFWRRERLRLHPRQPGRGAARSLPPRIAPSWPRQPLPGMHRYMNNAGYDETRAGGGRVPRGAVRRGGHRRPRRHDLRRRRRRSMWCSRPSSTPARRSSSSPPILSNTSSTSTTTAASTIEVWTDQDTFQPDIAAIEAAIGPQTRALIDQLAEQPDRRDLPGRDAGSPRRSCWSARKHELGRPIYVISDEPYARLAFDGNKVPPIFRLYPQQHHRHLPLQGSGPSRRADRLPGGQSGHGRLSSCSWRGRSSATGSSALSTPRR